MKTKIPDVDDDYRNNEEFIERIKEEISKQKLNKQDPEFPKKIGVSLSSYNKIVARNSGRNGAFKRIGGIKKICATLGIDLRDNYANEEFGGYSIKTYDNLCGDYYLIRPTFDKWNAIGRFHMNIAWRKEHRALVLSGYTDRGRQVGGIISIPAHSNYIKIHHVVQGLHSLMIFRHLDVDGYMHGQILTLGESGKGNFRPISGPIALIKINKHDGPAVELIKEEYPEYKRYDAILANVYKLDIESISTYYADKQRSP